MRATLTETPMPSFDNLRRWQLVISMWLCHLALASGIGLAYAWGWLDGMIATDTLYLVRINCALFVVGVVIAQRRAHWLSAELDGRPGSKCWQYRQAAKSVATFEALRMSVASRVNAVSFLAGQIMLFGLAGTIVGFVIATSGVTPEAATDAGQVGPMVAAMISGISLSLYKTLAGIALGGMYLMLLHRLLCVAATHALSRAVNGGR